MNLLFYDTETTGLPIWGDPSEAPHQPHIVQLAGKVIDTDTRAVIAQVDTIIKPDGWTIPEDTVAVHGITTERAMDEGIPEAAAVSMLLDLWRPTPEQILRRVAHNESFDARILRIALKRFYADDAVLHTIWKGGDALCTARMSAPIVNMPATTAMKKSGRGSWAKTPKLPEAYRFFFGTDFEGAHTAMGDVNACMAVYWAIKEREAAAQQQAA